MYVQIYKSIVGGVCNIFEAADIFLLLYSPSDLVLISAHGVQHIFVSIRTLNPTSYIANGPFSLPSTLLANRVHFRNQNCTARYNFGCIPGGRYNFRSRYNFCVTGPAFAQVYSAVNRIKISRTGELRGDVAQTLRVPEMCSPITSAHGKPCMHDNPALRVDTLRNM